MSLAPLHSKISTRTIARDWPRFLCVLVSACAPAASPAPAAPPPVPAPVVTTPSAVAVAPTASSAPAPAAFTPLLEQLAAPGPLTLPFDVDVKKVAHLVDSGDVRGAQREFDELAWQAFLALNWPATESGLPDGKKTLADETSPRVWLFWRPADTIFLPLGARPAPWSTAPAIEDLYRGKAAWRQHTTANETFQAFSGPLVDQNGKWVRYQVFVNREEFDYIFDNELYSLDGQAKFSQTTTAKSDGSIDFPVDDAAAGKHGAVEIKLAWKELSASEIQSKRFFTMPVNVKRALSRAELEKLKKSEVIEKVTAGLVGMHLSLHTRSSPEWIWATFEHVDNVHPHEDAAKKVIPASFANPKLGGCPAQGDPDNSIVNVLAKHNGYLAPGATVPVEPDPAHPANTWIETKTTKPVQVCRVDLKPQGQLNPLDATLRGDAQKLNASVQTELQKLGSVFRYYELIDTQWPIHPNAPAVPGGANSAPDSIAHKTPGDVVPVFLVNSIMETFFQKGQQPAGPLEQDDRLAPEAPPIDSTVVSGTESCVGCHYSAGICLGFKKKPDGEYLLDENGQRTPIYGENGHFGKTGHANFSWLLQLEAQAKPYSPAGGTPPAAPPARNTAVFLKSGANGVQPARATKH